MTDGEKMIWATAFVAYVTEPLQNPPKATTLNPHQWDRYEREAVASAVEAACGIVERFREAGEDIDPAWMERWEEMGG